MRVQRVQKVQRVQRGRWPAPAGLEVMAACGGRLCRKGRQPFGPRVVVSPFGDEFYNSALRNEKPYNRASPAGRLPGFIIMAPFIFKGVHHRCRQATYILAAEPPPQPSALKGLSNLRTFGAKAPSILRTLLSSEPPCVRESGITAQGPRQAVSRQPIAAPPAHQPTSPLAH